MEKQKTGVKEKKKKKKEKKKKPEKNKKKDFKETSQTRGASRMFD